MNPPTRKCSRCKRERPLQDFAPTKKGPPPTRCETCRARRRKAKPKPGNCPLPLPYLDNYPPHMKFDQTNLLRKPL